MSSSYDHRYAAQGTTHPEVDEATMTMVVKLRSWWVTGCGDDPHLDEEGEEVLTLKRLPCKYVTCYTCDGKAKHVNPDVDSQGLTAEDFEELGPQFQEDYFKGRYDVTCYNCAGKRVIPEIDRTRMACVERELLDEHEKLEREEAEYEAEYDAICESERRFGC